MVTVRVTRTSLMAFATVQSVCREIGTGDWFLVLFLLFLLFVLGYMDKYAFTIVENLFL